MLKLENVTAGYQKEAVIKNINVCFKKGRITALIGPNGSGKSTLLKTLVNICELLEGNIYLDNKPKDEIGRREFARRVSYLPQSHAGGAITVARMVLHGRFPHLTYPRRYGGEDYDACNKAMEATGILSLKDRRIEELSCGQRQKVYLAMALAGDMEVYLLDEPATYLDVRHQLELLEIIRKLKERGKTIAVILHDLDSVMQIADDVVIMEQGQAVFAGEPVQAVENGVMERVFRVRTRILKDEEGKKHLYFEGMAEG